MGMQSRVMTSSLWAHELSEGYPSVTEDGDADVVVIGAGIAGIVTAALLQQSGHGVLVVDRDIVGGVATRNTTAKVTALQGTTLSAITKARGVDAARSYAQAQLDAVDGLRTLIETTGADCAMTPATAVTFAFGADAASKVDAEFDAASDAGLVVTRNPTDLPFEVTEAIALDNQFHIDPARLCRALASGLGANHVFEHTTVTGVKDNGAKGCVVTIDGGRELRARHVVVATQSPIVDPLFLANRCRPMQSYAMAVKLAGDVPASMSIAADEFTISLRPATVDGEDYLIVGGNGHPTSTPGDPKRWDEIEGWARTHLGELEVAHKWATHDLVSVDHVPFVGRLSPHATGSWVATAFGKWGMTNAYVAARLIRDAIDEKDPAPWAATFDSTRIASTLNRNLVTAGTTAMQHIVGDRVTGRREPRCTHQGCVLRHDEALDTWDCPCHGSRFAKDGTVLQGPAVKSLRVEHD
jgi:glycine/D-amino acid oxidase-like deaminating enzyme